MFPSDAESQNGILNAKGMLETSESCSITTINLNLSWEVMFSSDLVPVLLHRVMKGWDPLIDNNVICIKKPELIS